MTAPATVDEVYAVFDRELSPDSLGPVSATRIARIVAMDRARATMTPEAYDEMVYSGVPDVPDVEGALTQLVADGRLITALGQSVRRTWSGVPKYKGDKPFKRDEAYYVRSETAARWAGNAEVEAKLRADAKDAADRVGAAFLAAGVSVDVSTQPRSGDVTLRLRAYNAGRLAELLERVVELDRRQGGRW